MFSIPNVIFCYRENLEWSLTTASVVVSNETERFNTYSKLTLSLDVERKTYSIYWLTVFLPIILLSGMSLLVFFIPTGSKEKVTYISVVCLSYLLLYVKTMEGIPTTHTVPLLSMYRIS